MTNSKNNSKNNFIVQGGILAMAGIIVRILGLVKRVPLYYIIGDVGNSYYSAAYEVYNIFYTIAVYGIPIAVSKLVSARVSKGEYRNADRLFKCSLKFAFVVGLVISSFVFIFAEKLAIFSHEPMSYMALKVLSPAIFVFCLSGVLRGYFQGMGSMVPTAGAQLAEQIVLVSSGIMAAYFLSKYGAKVGLILHNENYRNAYGAAGATLGCVLGAICALIFLTLVYKANEKRLKRQIYRDPSNVVDSDFDIYKTLIITILPIVISSFVNNISNYVDMSIHNYMMTVKGLESIKSVNWGAYSGRYSVLINVPIAIAASMGVSTVPTLSGSMRMKDYEAVKGKIENVIKVTMMVAFPCAFGIIALAPSAMYLLFSSTADVGPNLLRIGGIGVVLFSFSTLTNSILQGMNRLIKPITHGLIALVLHVSILYCLLRFTNMNIYAVALSNNFFSLFIGIMNIISIRKILGYRQELKKTFIMPLICSAIMGAVVFFIDRMFNMNGYSAISSRLLIVVTIMIGGFVYAALMLVTKTITKNEILHFPGGTKIYGIFHRLHLM